jgi:hypothetical protein
MVVSSFSCSGISTRDLNPIYNVPVLGTHKAVVATGDNVSRRIRACISPVPQLDVARNFETMTRRLLITATIWGFGLLTMLVYSRDLEEALWFLYDPLLIGFVWFLGVVIFILAAIRIRKQQRAAIACLVVFVFGALAFMCEDYLTTNVRFRLSQSHYEKRLQAVLTSEVTAKADDLAGVEGTISKRVAFYWIRGVTDNWVGLVFDPTDSLAEPGLSRGQAQYFGGHLVSVRHLNGHWYLCTFT